MVHVTLVSIIHNATDEMHVASVNVVRRAADVVHISTCANTLHVALGNAAACGIRQRCCMQQGCTFLPRCVIR